MRFERTTSSLARTHSTTELHPRAATGYMNRSISTRAVSSFVSIIVSLSPYSSPYCLVPTRHPTSHGPAVAYIVKQGIWRQSESTRIPKCHLGNQALRYYGAAI